MASGATVKASTPQAMTAELVDDQGRSRRQEPQGERQRREQHDPGPQQGERRVLAAQARHGQQTAEGDAQHAQDQPAETAAVLSGVGQVADGADDVQPTDAHAGQPHRDDAEQGAVDGAADQGGRLDGQMEDQPAVRAEDDLGGPDQDPPHPHAQQSTDRRGDDRVDRALETERAQQMRAAQTDRAHHAQLGLAFLAQHDEEVDHQQDTGHDAERPDEGEQRTDPGPLLRRVVEQIGLDRVELEVTDTGLAQRSLQIPSHRLGVGLAVEDAAVVGDQDPARRGFPGNGGVERPRARWFPAGCRGRLRRRDRPRAPPS